MTVPRDPKQQQAAAAVSPTAEKAERAGKRSGGKSHANARTSFIGTSRPSTEENARIESEIARRLEDARCLEHARRLEDAPTREIARGREDDTGSDPRHEETTTTRGAGSNEISAPSALSTTRENAGRRKSRTTARAQAPRTADQARTLAREASRKTDSRQSRVCE